MGRSGRSEGMANIAGQVGRQYRCIVPTYPAFKMGVGECIQFSYAGAPNGWFTLRYPNGDTVLLAGEEIIEVIE